MLYQNSRSPNATSILPISVIVLLFILLPSIAEAATTYYSGKDGRDTNTCTQAKSRGTAKLTIKAGLSCLSPSDTLVIGDGTYDEYILSTIPGGSAGNPTIIQAENRYGAILLPKSTGGWAVINIDEPYVTIDGLVVDATYVLNNGGYYIRNLTDDVGNVTIQNGIARNGITPGSNIFSEPTGILLDHGQNYIIRNMEITNFRAHGIYDPSTNILIEDCYIHDWSPQSGVSAYAIHSYPNPHSGTIRRNRIADWQQGIIVTGSDLEVSHNLVYNTLNDGIKIRYGATNTNVYNNTVFGNSAVCISIGGDTRGTVVQKNICHKNGMDAVRDDTGAAEVGNNFLGIDPLFVNAAAGDFRLTANSPALGMGAFTSTNNTPPSAPVNLRVVGN